jgi:hypothetical protein
MPRPSDSLDLITLIIIFGDFYKLWRPSLRSLLQSPVYPPLRVRIFSPCSQKTLNFSSFLSVRDQVSHPYKPTSKIIVFFCILIFKFSEKGLEDKNLSFLRI